MKKGTNYDTDNDRVDTEGEERAAADRRNNKPIDKKNPVSIKYNDKNANTNTINGVKNNANNAVNQYGKKIDDQTKKAAAKTTPFNW